MSIQGQYDDVIRKLYRMIFTIAGRGLIRAINHASKLQTVQVQTGSGLSDDVEYIPPYGVISNPAVSAAAEAIYFCPFGQKEQMVVLTIIDRSTRPTDLADNDSGSYHAEGHRVLLNEGGHIRLATVGAGQVHLGTEDAQTPIVLDGDPVVPSVQFQALQAQLSNLLFLLTPMMNAAPGTPVVATGPGSLTPVLAPAVIGQTQATTTIVMGA